MHTGGKSEGNIRTGGKNTRGRRLFNTGKHIQREKAHSKGESMFKRRKSVQKKVEGIHERGLKHTPEGAKKGQKEFQKTCTCIHPQRIRRDNRVGKKGEKKKKKKLTVTALVQQEGGGRENPQRSSMETGVVTSLYDYLYILFDDYVVNNSKDVHSYRSIFHKKEFVEFIKYHSNIKVPPKHVISNKDEIIDELIYAFKNFGKYINGCDMFSNNEEVDDINTKCLKYLLIPYILGVLSYETVNIDLRYDRLKESKLYFNEFLRIINTYKITHMDDYLFDEEECNSTYAMNRRNVKVKRAKDEKKYEEIYHEIVKANCKKCTNHNADHLDDVSDENNREMYLSLIKCKCIQTLNMVDLIDTELRVLEMRNTERKREQVLKNDSRNDVNNMNAHAGDKNGIVRKPWLFTIKKNMQISDISQIRNYYKDLVFKPSHNLPTISLEECAEIEMQFAVKGNERGSGRSNGKGGDQFDIQDEGEEDYYKKHTQEEREKEMRDREWDDWKDMHQKGIGNKNRNIA
ncbi:type 2A phosphatase-associated protein 42, putative (TAP42) [Plasmodium ovale wallikeri]|uniref:Type 2A phosphatase-associated protein 42, putative (TAP42) n=1 Tax=Plasmodium ovale wallikeri TaxID=864142 RepID=A0A1A8YIN7_PLAOA|nr:type 2A phosphatase-associated protein 42, putative (TAP42) [Plasmodium ovale wallikeri]